MEKPYDFKNVVNLIINNRFKDAIDNMIDFTERHSFNISNNKLVACSSRLHRIENKHHAFTINYETFTLHLNKIVNQLQRINHEISELDKVKRKRYFAEILKLMALSILLSALLFLLFPVFFKNNNSYPDITNNENQKRQIVIEDFYIQNGNCLEDTYAIIQIKNTGRTKLKDIYLKWTPDINFEYKNLVYTIQELPINKTDIIKIPLQGRLQNNSGRYRSSLEEDHPIPAFPKIYQNFELVACKMEALPIGLEEGGEVDISYNNQYEKTTRLIRTDSISLPMNSQNFKIKK